MPHADSELSAILRRISQVQSDQTVRLIAVSKTKPAEDVANLARLGQLAFGENYVQEALLKQRQVKALMSDDSGPLEWHAIGPIQSKKCRDVALHFDWLQSLDRVKLVDQLARFREPIARPLHLLIQVNIDDESSKSGVSPDQILAVASHVQKAGDILQLRGLMAIPKVTEDLNQTRISFLRMRDMYQRLRDHIPRCDTLSMGMSSDFELAIECGSTMVRIGSALFGTRG